MKGKLALLLTCLLLAAPLCAAEEAPLTGAWVLESVSMEASLEDGSLAFAYDIAEGGGEVELTLEPDGSAHVSVTEGVLDAASLSYLTGWEADAESWAMDGENVLVTAPSGAVLTLTPEEDALCARQQGATLRFVRPEAAASAAIRADATLEDFAGSWTAVSIAMGGMEMPTDMLGMELSADIEGDAITFTKTVGDEPDTVETCTGVLEEGALTVGMEDGSQLTLRLREDGAMTAQTPPVMDDMRCDIRFERAA